MKIILYRSIFVFVNVLILQTSNTMRINLFFFFTWRRPEVKFGRNVEKEETTQKLPI